jgi:hypothetical protein
LLANDTTSASSPLSLRDTVSVGVLDDGAVLLDLESKYFYVLNATGWAIAQLFESGASAGDVRRIAGTWGAPNDGSVDAFIAQLGNFGLLEQGAAADDERDLAWDRPWSAPTIERQAEPLQNVMVTAFDPSIPLAE